MKSIDDMMQEKGQIRDAVATMLPQQFGNHYNKRLAAFALVELALDLMSIDDNREQGRVVLAEYLLSEP